MNFNDLSIGTDIEEVDRFKNRSLENDRHFFSHIFTENELGYCFSKGIPAQHLCARFCGKEAVIKALFPLNITNVYLKDIEILNTENGIPYVKIEKYPNLNIKISLSHSKKYATATAIIVS